MRSDAAARVCVSIIGSSRVEFFRKIREAEERGARLIELRLDGLRDGGYIEVIEEASGRAMDLVCTLRPREEGGVFEGGEDERRALLLRAAERCRYVDIEYSTLLAYPSILEEARRRGASVIVSKHFLERQPGREELLLLAEEMERPGSLVKIVTRASSLDEASALLSLYGNRWAGGRLIAFSMGERWSMTRLISLLLGAPFTYASLGAEGTAPGQPTLEELVRSLEMLSGVMGPRP